MDKSDTPRTDVQASCLAEGGLVKRPDGAVVDVEFARQLERELAEANRKVDLAQTLLYRAKERGELTDAEVSTFPSAVAELADAEILKVYKEEYFAVENGNLRHGDSDLAVIAAVRRVVAARSATTASKWIPISERKPETRIRVLTSNELIVEVMYIDWDGKWHFENGQRVVMEHHFPTHWQPLPERVGKGSIGVSGVAVAPFERLIEKSMAESPVFLPLAIQLLNSVKAWRDCDGNDGFPQEVREQIDALLTAYELREQEKRTLG